MWTCPECGRIFEKTKQPHSCRKILLEEHFKNKKLAKKLFDTLLDSLRKVGESFKIISLPCCIHLYGLYDYLAALPKKDGLEIRFALKYVLETPRLKQSVPVSQKYYKNCIDVVNKDEINNELLTWIDEAYHLKDSY